MFVRPRFFDFDFVDWLLKTAFCDYGYREPLNAIGGLYAVAIMPMPLHILHAVKDYVFVTPPN